MTMSPSLKPLLLPQLVEERKKVDVEVHTTSEDDMPYTSYTNNSSSSDIVSPITPTFSAKGHFRGSSSASSLDLAYAQFQDTPSSPTQQLSQQPSKRQLPDVEEEPFERDEDKTVTPDHFGLYSCLCDEPCDHRKSSEQVYPGDFLTDQEFDYDIDCLSDGETSAAGYPSKHGSGHDSPFLGLTTRFGSRFNTVNRWKSNWKSSLTSPPTTEISFENVLSRGHSSRSSSMSSPSRRVSERPQEPPALSSPSMSCYDSVDSIDSLCEKDARDALDPAAEYERDRAQATTPLLPPLLTSPLAEPPPESPLQSPSIAPSSAATETRPKPSTTVNYSRPSLSTRPSVSSLRNGPYQVEPTLPLSAFLQEHDEWSDRLGHANFTITPQPYELESSDSEALSKFREDWEAARVNYTKHLVRTGENYGQTSKIYGLTEAKWAQTEARWKSIYDAAIKQAMPADSGRHVYTISSRSRSRGRGRGRSGSTSASIMGRPANGDSFAEMHWQRIEETLPSAVPVPRMLDAEGKFPERGDEDIVGPMHRAETMERSPSEEKHGAKFWKNLAGKVGLRR